MTASPDALALLALLGDSADEIAASLEASGVRGYPSDATHCPLAVYLRRHDLFADVTPKSVSFFTLGRFAPVPLPDAHREFVRRFDRGDYPCLLAPVS